jgi:hypothetical protein
LNRAGEEELLEESGVLLGRDVVERERLAEAGEVGELARVVREQAQQAGHLGELPDLRNIAHVALHDGAHVVEVPLATARPRGAFQGLGVAAGQDGGDEVRTGDGGADLGRAAAKRLGEEMRDRAAHLGGREG